MSLLLLVGGGIESVGSMSASEGDGTTLSGPLEPNWYYFFEQQAAGVDYFESPIAFPAPIFGDLTVQESGADALSATGGILIQGLLVVSEDGSDVFVSTGDSVYEGDLSVAEVGSDAAAFAGQVLIAGALSVDESGADVFASEGDNIYQGYLSVAEVGSDTLVASGQLLVAGQLSVAETGADELAATGTLPISGAMAVTEASSDSFLASGASAKPIVVSGGRRRTDLDWPDWPVYGPEQARVTKRKRDELLLLMS